MSDSASPKKSGCLRQILWSVLFLIAFLVAAHQFVNWSGNNRWEETKSRLEKAGLPMEYEQVAAPILPPGENFGNSPLLRAVCGLDGAEGVRRLENIRKLRAVFRKVGNFRSTPESTKALRTALQESGDWEVPSVDQEPNDHKAVLQALRPLDDQFDELIAHAKRPQALLPGNVAPPSDEVPQEAGKLIGLYHILGMFVYCHTLSCDTGRATALIQVMMRTWELAGKRSSMSGNYQLTGGWIVTCRAILIGLDNHRWSATDLDALAEATRKHPLPRYAEGMRNKWVSIKNEYDHLATSGKEDYMSFTDPTTAKLWKFLPVGFVRQAQADQAEIMQGIANAIETSSLAGAIAELDRLSTTEDATSSIPWIRFPCLVASNFKKSFQDLQFQEFFAQAIQIQIALEKQFLQTGSYPIGLSELVPTHLQAIPLDLDGKALRYLREAPNKYCIWSVGANGVDDWSGDWTKMKPNAIENYRASDWMVTLPSLQSRFDEKAKALQKPAPQSRAKKPGS